MVLRGWQMLVIIVVLLALGAAGFLGGMTSAGLVELEGAGAIPLKRELILSAPWYTAIPIAIFYVALAYIALVVLIVGIIYRAAVWAATPKGPGGLYWGLYRLTLHPYVRSWWDSAGIILARLLTFFTILKSNFGRRAVGFWLSVALFHWCVWLVLLFHANSIALGSVISMTEKYIAPMAVFYGHVSHELKLVMGGTCALIAIAAGLALLFRRAWVPARFKVWINPSGDDWAAILWVLVILALGLTAKLWSAYEPGLIERFAAIGVPRETVEHVVHDYGSVMYYLVGCWLAGLISARPDVAINAIHTIGYYALAVAPYYGLILAHIMLVMCFMIYLPWSKMIHPIAMPFNPALYGKFEKVEPSVRKLEEVAP